MSQTVRTLPREKVPDLLRAIGAAGKRVIAPVEEGGRVAFGPVGPGSTLRLDVLRTQMSPKAVLFPMTETLFGYKHSGDGVEFSGVGEETPETVVWGVRPCDCRALTLLDRVFGEEQKDPSYLAKRERTTFVSSACEAPDAFCFCTSVGGAPDSEEGSDLILRPLVGGRYQAKALTARGEALLKAFPAFFGEAGGEVARAPEVPVRFDREGVRAKVDSKGFFDDEVWEAIGLPCMGCGTCAYVCPTCHCFDIADESSLTEGRRVKNWDSCGFGLFTKEAAGHNPRANQPARYRQRVMHKFSYIPKRYALIGCVGCGRCSERCPAGIDIAHAIAEIREAEAKS